MDTLKPLGVSGTCGSEKINRLLQFVGRATKQLSVANWPAMKIKLLFFKTPIVYPCLLFEIQNWASGPLAQFCICTLYWHFFFSGFPDIWFRKDSYYNAEWVQTGSRVLLHSTHWWPVWTTHKKGNCYNKLKVLIAINAFVLKKYSIFGSAADENFERTACTEWVFFFLMNTGRNWIITQLIAPLTVIVRDR